MSPVDLPNAKRADDGHITVEDQPSTELETIVVRAGTTAAEDDDLTRIVPREDETRVIPGPTADGQAPNRVDAAPPVGATNSFATLAPMRAAAGDSPADPDRDPSTKQVGRYLVLERLGRGGMATVFRARDPGIGRDVALKFLHASLCEDDEYRGRFLREARAAGGLSHPNIVTVHDVGEIDGRPYMAMELLSGKPLGDLLVTGKQLPIRDVVIMGMQLARALDYSHSRGIVHRDIKPGNIALLEGTNTIKVMDFGIAHMDGGGVAEQHTRVGDVLGTPQYMSPEQTRGDKLDGRSDLFSAGIVLYQMIAGQRPFQGGSVVATALKIAQEQPPGLDKLRPEVPASLRRVVERCLAKSPDQRFQTGRELSEALGRVLVQIDEAVRQKERPRIVPLRVKWAGTMALIVALVMALVASVITQRQYAAMMGQVSDNGAALARFIAAQNAEAALSGEQWPVVDANVHRIMDTGDFQSITIVDRQGVVRAASDAELVDHPFSTPSTETLKNVGDVVSTRYQVDGEPVLGFEAPIVYANDRFGRVLVGLKEAPLLRVVHLSILLMAVLVLVTVAAVAIAMYFVADWFSRPIKVVRDAMDEVAHGHLDCRIGEVRNDEFGQLYGAFDRMAQAVQDARSGVSVAMTTLSKAMPAPTAPEPHAPVGAAPPSPAAPA